MSKILILIGAMTVLFACTSPVKKETKMKVNEEIKQKADEFATFKLTTDLGVLSTKERQMLPLLLEAAKIMEEIYWMEAFGDKKELVDKEMDQYTKKFVEINYGPWERLIDNKPFLKEYGPKPKGAKDITKEEFEAWNEESKTSLYTLIRRGEDGQLKSIPYNIAFEDQVKKASDLILKAAALAEDPGLKNYLEMDSI